jgi:hypothetical protein
MLSNPHFYNRTIRKVVVAFGSMFNDIEIVRFLKDGTPKERFKVPLSYGAKEKYLTQITSDPSLTKSVATVIPRISFNLEGMSYDASRKQVTTLKNFGNSGGTFASQYVPVPYDFTFTMSLYVRNTEDGTQILEQILPFFTPDFTVTIDFISAMDQKYDMPVILNSVSSSVEYEGDMSTTRLILWDLDFTAKGYIWPAVRADNANGKLIRYANTNLYNMANTKLVNILTTPDPLNAEPDDEFGFNEEITEYFQGKYGTINNRPLPGGENLFDGTSPASLDILGTPVDPGGTMNLDGYSLSEGLYRKKYEGYFDDDVNWFDGKTPLHGTPDGDVSFSINQNDDTFSMQWLGYFKPDITGNYNFWLVSDDASYLWIGQNALSGYTTSNAVINNGGQHPVGWATNTNSLILEANKYYPIRIQMGDNISDETLQLFYALAGNNGNNNFDFKIWHNNTSLGF